MNHLHIETDYSNMDTKMIFSHIFKYNFHLL